MDSFGKGVLKGIMTGICFIMFIYCFVAIFTWDGPIGIAGGAGAGWLFLAKDWWDR